VFQVAEYFFCVYYSYEWIIRFLAFKRKLDGLKDAWFVFDSLLVISMVSETWLMSCIILLTSSGGGLGTGSPVILRLARLLRLSRMARMARLLRAMPELLILIKGMFAAVRSVVFTLGLLLAIIYVFAVTFTQLCVDTPCESVFSDVPASVHMLWLNGALMDNLGVVIVPLQEQGVLYLMVFYLFLIIAALTLKNMLIGVICEVVSAVASSERETMALTYVKQRIKTLMSESDQDDDNKISKVEFMELLTKKEAALILKDVGVDVVGLVDFADMIFEQELSSGEETDSEVERRLSFAEFMGVILDLRGSNTATVKDIVELRKYVKGRFTQLEKKVVEASTGLPRRRSSLRKCLSRASLDSIRMVAEDETSCDILSDKDIEQDVFSRRLSHKTPKRMTPDSSSATTFRSALDESVSQMLAAHAGEMATLQAEIKHLQQALLKHEHNEKRRSELCVRCGESCGTSKQISDSDNSVGRLSKEVVCQVHQWETSKPPNSRKARPHLQDRASKTSSSRGSFDGSALRLAPTSQDELSCAGVIPMAPKNVPPDDQAQMREAQKSGAACGHSTCGRSFQPGASGGTDGSRSGAPGHPGLQFVQDL